MTFGDRCDELAVTEPSPNRLFVPLAELQALRGRLQAHLEVPDSRNDYVGTWTECTIDTDALFGELSGVWLRPGWRLRAYAYRVGSNGNGVVWALPPEAPDPAPLGTIRGSLHYPPRPAGARSCREALTGDGSLLSYMHASILIRELGEFGALWHGVSWGAHQLIEWLPADEPWKFELRLPWRLGPRVVRHDDAVSVVFYSVNHECVVRLLRHVDYYPRGEYQVWRGEIEAARGGPGYIP
ncbi:MAG: hypothetical protein HC927_06710 [Deltaproteobacteria bacterium]|nr:hypothetical protein [Deltaproteobacteria bacterium]